MRKLLLILILHCAVFGKANCQNFSYNDLVSLASQQSKNVVPFMKKKGFFLSEGISDSTAISASFIPKPKRNSPAEVNTSIKISVKDNCKCITLQTTDANDFLECQNKIIKSGFIYDTLTDITKASSVLFQKANIAVVTSSKIADSTKQYCIEYKVHSIPDEIIYAEDLLQFNSHEFLENFFGKENVKKDMYYLSEKELKKCSVLFSGTRRQALFVWDDEHNLSNLAYVIVTNSLPTEGAKQNDPLPGNNQWKMKNGICPGMEIKDLLKINESDFDIYGNKSELAFLIKPDNNGKVDFKQTAIMLNCHECFDNKIFNQPVVSALQVAKANIPMRVFDVVIYAKH